MPAQYQALNIVSGRELASPVATGFRVVSFDNKTLILESGDGGIRKPTRWESSLTPLS